MLNRTLFFATTLAIALLNACTPKQAQLPIDSTSVAPGTEVSSKGERLALAGIGIEVGQ